MPHYRMTARMRQLERTWSYVWFAQAASAAQAIRDYTEGAFIGRLARVHHRLTRVQSLHAARVSSTAENIPPRETARKAIGPMNLSRPPSTFTVQNTDRPDVVSGSAVINIVSDGGPTRTLSLRGLEDGEVRRNALDGGDEPSPGLIQRINELLESFANNPPALVRARIGETVAGFLWRDVVTLAPVANTDNLWTRVTTTEAHGFLKGHNVIFGGEIDCGYEGLRGEFQLLNVTDTTFDIRTRYRGSEATQAVRKVQVRRSEYNYFPMLFRPVAGGPPVSGFSHFGSRDTGTTRNGQRGRRPGKSCRV